MSGKVVKRAPRKKGANAYKMPDPISAGEILTDITKKQWILGKSIGVGGFGEIYSAAPYNGKTPKEYPNVIKIEPHGNGPLFVEMHFYMRNAKSDEIDSWQRKKKLSSLGMPRYIGSGSHEYKHVKYRFVVMDRYGTDLWKLFQENNKEFPEHTVYKIALQIINVLEYIHHKTYVHADIKGANLLLDLKSQDRIYLVDFGLASHYTTKNEFKLDPKKAHNGTIEYTSRDAHMGVPTMRGDFEILGYNMIHWLSGSLLWEKDGTNPTAVQKSKETAFENVSEFLNKCFDKSVPEPILKYMNLLATIKFNETPDYEKFKKILTDGLKELCEKPDGSLEFKVGLKKVKNSINTEKPPLKSTPQKLKKAVERTRKSPRAKLTKSPSPVRNLDESTDRIVIDKKRVGANAIKAVLNDIEPDAEYDVIIAKKTKVGRQPNSRNLNKGSPKNLSKGSSRNLNNGSLRNKRKKENYNTSNSDSEPEIVSKGTRSRPNLPSHPKKLSIHESSTDEDMFNM